MNDKPKHKTEKTAAGEGKPGAERPDGKPQPAEGHQPAKVEGETPSVPELQPGRDPNNKARHR